MRMSYTDRHVHVILAHPNHNCHGQGVVCIAIKQGHHAACDEDLDAICASA